MIETSDLNLEHEMGSPRRRNAESAEANKQDGRALPIYPPTGTEEEREKALLGLFEMARRGGWRSEGPYGPRDELYDR